MRSKAYVVAFMLSVGWTVLLIETRANVGVGQTADERAMVRTLIRGALHREQLMENAAATFTHIRFYSRKEREALENALSTDTAQRTAESVVDGGFSVVRVRAVAAPPKLWWEAKLLSPGHNQWTGPTIKGPHDWVRTVCDGDTEVEYHAHSCRAHVKLQELLYPSLALTRRVGSALMLAGQGPLSNAEALYMPLAMSEGNTDLARKMGLSVEESQPYVKYEGEADIGDVACHIVSTGHLGHQGAAIERKAWIAPAYGYAIVRLQRHTIIESSQYGRAEFLLTRTGRDWQKIGQDLWAPFEVRKINYEYQPDGEPRWLTVDIWQFDELRINCDIPSDQFSLRLPLGTHIMDSSGGADRWEGDTKEVASRAESESERLLHTSLEEDIPAWTE